MAIDRVSNQTTFEAWHDLFNTTTWYTLGLDTVEEARREAYDKGIKQKLLNGVQDESLFLIKDFKEKIPNNLKGTREEEQRIQEFKRFLTLAINNPDDNTLKALGYDSINKDADDGKAFISIMQTGEVPLDANGNPDISGRNKVVRQAFFNFFERFGNRNNKSWWSWTGSNPPEKLEETMEQLAASGSRAQIDQFNSGFKPTSEESDKKATIEDTQCLLMSMIFDNDSYVNKNIAYTSGRNIVLNMWADEYNSELNNRLVSDPGLKRLFEIKHKPNEFKKALYLVKDVETSSSVGGLNFYTAEFPLSTNTSKIEDDTAARLAAIETKIITLGSDSSQKATVLDLQAQRSNLYNTLIQNTSGDTEGNFLLDSINIKYEGTNPSTAREDVKVQLKFKLESFMALNTVIGNYIDKVDTDKKTFERLNITLKDLIVKGLGGDQKTGYMTALKNSYAPEHNRLRIKINAENIKDDDGVAVSTGNPLTLDLTIIDHSLTRNASNGTVDLAINYRGYFHSVMTMPFSDILASKEVRQRREERRENLQKLIQKSSDCKTETLREILRIERNTFEQENSDARFSELLDYIYKNFGIYKATFDIDKSGLSTAAALSNLPEAGSKNYVKNKHSFGKGVSVNSNADYNEALKIAVAEEQTSASVNADSATWVALGAIIESAVVHLYKPVPFNNKPEMHDYLGGLNLRLALLPSQVPNPKTGSTVTIFPSQLPVDIKFFAEWWNENVVRKDLKVYPAGIFIRDIIEKLVNNLLFEVCLSHLLPDEAPPRMRCQYMTSRYSFVNGLKPGTRNNDDGNPVAATDICYLNGANGKAVSNYSSKPIPPYFSELPNNDDLTPKQQIVNTNSYLVIYQQSAPLIRELNSQRTTTLKDTDYIPTIVSGLHSKGFSQVNSVSFSKNTAPFLREARYHNNNFGGLALMNNVYDLSFSMTDHHANTYFFPGMIINFIVTDFSGVATVLQIPPTTDDTVPATTINVAPADSTSVITPLNYRYTDNDPHNQRITEAGNSNTMAYILGFGGYYTIKSVEYDISSADAYWTINVTAKFTGTDYDTNVVRGDPLTAIEKDKPECIDYYTEARRLNEAEIQATDPEGETSFQNTSTGNTSVAQTDDQDNSLSSPTITSTVPAPTAQKIDPSASSSVPKHIVKDPAIELKDFAKESTSAIGGEDYPDGVWIQFLDENEAQNWKRVTFDDLDIFDPGAWVSSKIVGTKPEGSQVKIIEF